MTGRGGITKRASVAEKPWASGRVLTPDQRARKQEADRKANRFLKKEVQDRLGLLEARVLELEKFSSNCDDSQVVENLNDRGSFSTVADPGPSSSNTRSSIKPTGWGTTEGRTGEQNASGNRPQELLPAPSVTSCRPQFFNAPDPVVTLRSSHADDMHNNADSRPSENVPLDFTNITSTARMRPEGRHLTCFLNNLVNYIRSLPFSAICFDDRYNQDLVVSATLKGWESTLSRYRQACPLWHVLRLVDLYILKEMQLVERLSCLRMLHRRYLFEVNSHMPTAGPPPPWFRPQFSEKVFFHDPVIDHLTWPRLRDRLIASEEDRLTNKFWILFARNLRVTWRGEPFDAVGYSAENQLYHVNAMYENSLYDINNWRMDMEFFRGMPQLAGIVPPHNYMPLRTVSPKFGTEDSYSSEQNQPAMSPAFTEGGSPQPHQHPDRAIPQEPWMTQDAGFAVDLPANLTKFPHGGLWN